ncbi:hypothetical protein [Cupriavidus plantarum]|uniref:hypothetical protein n=1 Tax=Cupriavidus plantarum TaxID=942865 RepID=UPI000EB035AF|nr:hypothetical protein [Cupriavidus plantarum]RLK45684.1 hypothetical protein C7417_1706 [Cupriavidus plantarum]
MPIEFVESESDALKNIASALKDGDFVDLSSHLIDGVLARLDPDVELWMYLSEGDARLPLSSTDHVADKHFLDEELGMAIGSSRPYYSSISSAQINSRTADVVVRDAEDGHDAVKAVEAVLTTIRTRVLIVIVRSGPAPVWHRTDDDVVVRCIALEGPTAT